MNSPTKYEPVHLDMVLARRAFASATRCAPEHQQVVAATKRPDAVHIRCNVHSLCTQVTFFHCNYKLPKTAFGSLPSRVHELWSWMRRVWVVWPALHPACISSGAKITTVEATDRGLLCHQCCDVVIPTGVATLLAALAVVGSVVIETKTHHSKP